MAREASGPPYRVAYTVTADGVIDASRLMMQRTFRWMTAAGWLVAAAGLLVTILGEPGPGIGLVAAGLFLAVVINLRSFRRWSLRRRGLSTLGTTVELTIGEDGVAMATAHSSGRIAWSGLTDVREDAKTVLFVRGRLALAWAPADAFGGTDRRLEILGFSRAQVASASPTT